MAFTECFNNHNLFSVMEKLFDFCLKMFVYFFIKKLKLWKRGEKLDIF